MRKQVLRRLSASPGSGGSRNALGVWWSAALFALLAPPVWAQYTPPNKPETPGGATRASQDVPKEPGTPAAGRRAWNIQPKLSVDETYTDNVRLKEAGSERSDWVTRVMPGVLINGTGPRVRLNANYSPQFVDRAQEGTKDIFHRLNAKGDAELVQRLLFVDVQAAITQTNISLLGPQAESTVNNNSNQTSLKSLSVSPYLRHDFGSKARGEARLGYSTVSADRNDLLVNSHANRTDLGLTSGPAFKLLTWNLAYSKEHIEYSQTQRGIDTEKITAGAKPLIIPNVRLQANVGYDDNNYGTTGPPPKGVFWSLGPEWRPTPRTRLSATTGRAYFGPTRSLDFSHRTRLTKWSLDYSEDVTTARSLALVPPTENTDDQLDALFLSSIPDPAARQTAVGDFISQNGLPPTLLTSTNSLSTMPFLMKRLRASFGIHGIRNTVLANMFTQTRESVVAVQAGAGDFAVSPTTKQTGASLLWTLRVTRQAASNLSVGYTHSELPATGSEIKLKFVRLGFTQHFGPRLSGALNYRRLQSDSNQAASDYTENAVSALLNMSF